jgi:hypothetical protein
MAVVLIKEVPGRTATITRGVVNRYRRFKIKCSNRLDDENTIKSSMPPILSGYYDTLSGFSDPACTLKRISLEQDKRNPLYRWANLEYDTEIDEKSNGSEQGDDLPNLRTKVAYGTWIKTEAFDKDKDGNKILLSNGLPPNPPYENENGYKQFTITLYQLSSAFTSAQHYDKLFYTNSLAWKGHNPKTLVIRDVVANPQYEKGVEIYEIVYTIVHNPSTWQVQLLNIGTHKKDPGGGLPQPIKIGNTDVKEPHLLGNDGLPTTTPTTTDKDIRYEVDYATLPINLANVR